VHTGKHAKVVLFGTTMATGGCALRGAPSFVLFGAYFPAWMLLALIGIFAAALTRVLALKTGVAAALPFQLALCTSAGVTTAVIVWLIWFAP
jgi:hypothetical protein